MTTTRRADFKSYSIVVVDMADCSLAQSCADMSRFRLVRSASDAMQSLSGCAGLNLTHCEERRHPVVNDHCLGRERRPGKTSHLRFLGRQMVGFFSSSSSE